MIGSRHDVAVVGLGPAGRALAHRLAARGARVLGVDPAPDERWRRTLGGWARQLPAWLDTDVAGATAPAVLLRTPAASHSLSDAYVVLDNDRLQDALALDGISVVRDVREPGALHEAARVVVDCRGSWPAGTTAPDVAHQTAWGMLLPPTAARGLLDGADAVLMDWTPPDGAVSWGRDRPSFCYVVPLPDGRVLAEETCLAGRPALDAAVLRRRLVVRLQRHGVGAPVLAAAASERVSIPLVPAPRPGDVQGFGAAGAELNPITGYSVFASLQQADRAALHLLADGVLPPVSPVARQARLRALGALLRLPGDSTVALFDAFGRLEPARQLAVFDPHASPRDLLTALAAQASLLPARHRAALVAATARGAAPRRPRRVRSGA